MPLNRDHSQLRLRLAEALYNAAGCKEWPLCTDPAGCEAVYHLLPELGVTLENPPDRRVDYSFPSIAPWELKPVLDTIFAMAEYGTLRLPNIFEGWLEIPFEIGQLLEANNDAWREELLRLEKVKERTSAQKMVVVQFIREMLEIAIPDSYLELCPLLSDESFEYTAFSTDTAVADTLNTEERLLLIDRLWIPDWSSPLPKSSRRLIGLVLAAIDGRLYATPFVTVDGNLIEHYVEMNIDLRNAFGFSDDEATQALRKAMSGILEIHNAAGTTPPFIFNT